MLDYFSPAGILPNNVLPACHFVLPTLSHPPLSCLTLFARLLPARLYLARLLPARLYLARLFPARLYLARLLPARLYLARLFPARLHLARLLPARLHIFRSPAPCPTTYRPPKRL